MRFPDDEIRVETKSAYAEVHVMADMTGALRLEVSYYPWSTSEARNGDTFSVRIYDASEKMVFLYRDQPELTEIYPNGPSCPPRCMQARVDWTPTR